jgi:hypothetical protein
MGNYGDSMVETKICTCCKDELPGTKEYFNTAKNGYLQLTAICRVCMQCKYLRGSDKIKEKQRKLYSKNSEKYSESKKIRRLEDPEKFKKQSRASYRRNRKNALAYQKTHREQNIDKIRVRVLERKFNTTEKIIQDFMDAQRGCCGICKDSLVYPNSYKSYAVDHDHRTGEVRGLLCSNCNRAIGLLMDDTKIVRSAAEYLERYNGK